MKVQHSAVRSDVFKLVNTLEFDIEVGEHFLPTRVELFQDTERKGHWRCRMWERDLYHLQLTLPQGKKRKLKRAESDEEVLVERTWEVSSRFEDFKAPTARVALKKFLDAFREYLNRISR